MAEIVTPEAAGADTGVEKHRFTVAEFFRMGELGLFHPEQRLELLDGTVYEMAPQGPDHARPTHRLTKLFWNRIVASGKPLAEVWSQLPIVIPDFDAPEPDVALLKREPEAGYHPGPGDVLLLVEVSRTTLSYDRQTKGPKYAAAGIPEYWILDVRGKALEVYREPREGAYPRLQVLRAGDEVAVEALPELGAFAVADILG